MIHRAKRWLMAQFSENSIDLPEGLSAQWVDYDNVTQQATLTLPYAADVEAVAQQLAEHPATRHLSWQVQIQVKKLPNSQPELPLTTGNVIVVSSGKGGVGKSSVSVSLALGLQQLGARVGVLDADIYGPSIPTMLGRSEHELQINARNKMEPMERFGLQVNSLGYLVKDEDATIWRGPMASSALQQLYRDTHWQDLDYLIVDMPPGTGDIQLTMAQKLPVTGAVVVTTPQTVALKDAEKGIAMFNKLDIPIIGVLENMSFYQCSQCGQQEAIFGEGGGAEIAKAEGVELLGQWPLTTAFRDSLDHQAPLPIADPEHPFSQLIKQTAAKIAATSYHKTIKNV